VFSERTSFTVTKNPLTLAIEARRQKGLPILDLTESNPTVAGFHYDRARILKALTDPRGLLYEPAPFGLAAGREAVAAYYRDRGQIVDPCQVVLTASTSEAYSFLFKLLADPGDEILIPRPSYPLFDFLARLNDVRTVQFPLVYEGAWRLDRPAFEASVSDKTRAVVFVSPNNPTGSVLESDDWKWLADFLSARRIPFIWDEVFHDYPLDHRDFIRDPLSDPDVAAFVLNGLSKTVALPQLKLAWIVVVGPTEFREQALERLEIVADTYLSVGTPIQHALPDLLASRAQIQQEICVRLAENLAALRAALKDTAGEVLPAAAGWNAVVRLPRVKTEEQWVMELLEEHGILVHPGYFYDFEDEAFIVVSLLTPARTFHFGIDALARLL